MMTQNQTGLERGVEALAIRPELKLGKNARRKGYFIREKLSARQEDYLRMIREELSSDGDSVRRRIETLMFQGWDTGADGRRVEIDVHAVTKVLLETKASGAMRKKHLTPPAVQDGRALLCLAEQVVIGVAR